VARGYPPLCETLDDIARPSCSGPDCSSALAKEACSHDRLALSIVVQSGHVVAVVRALAQR
jgi:hypothetical protein